MISSNLQFQVDEKQKISIITRIYVISFKEYLKINLLSCSVEKLSINYLSNRSFLTNMFTLYTPQTANKILPEVKRVFAQIVSEKNKVVSLQEQLQMIVESGSDFERFMTKKQEINLSVSNLYKAIEQLENTGVMIKSVDEGLLDFPSKRFDEEVWLCWKAGEDRIKFWHGKDEGFMGRKPLVSSGFPASEGGLDPAEAERMK